MNYKGFIGAIGDDLPSIIPLFFAILIFFSSLAYAFTTINERDNYINTYIESLRVAKTALSDGLFTSIDDFKLAINNIVSNSNYLVGLVYLDNKKTADLDPNMFDILNKELFLCHFDDGFVLNEELGFNAKNNINNPGECYDDNKNIYLTYSPSLENSIEGGINIVELSRYNKLFVYTYPVGVMTPKGVLPVFLIVVVW